MSEETNTDPMARLCGVWRLNVAVSAVYDSMARLCGALRPNVAVSAVYDRPEEAIHRHSMLIGWGQSLSEMRKRYDVKDEREDK